jgi:hypothetical protein
LVILYSPTSSTYHVREKNMHPRTFRPFIYLVSTFVFLLASATLALGAAQSPVEQSSIPSSTPLDAGALEQYWQEMYPAQVGIQSPSNVYTHELRKGCAR